MRLSLTIMFIILKATALKSSQVNTISSKTITTGLEALTASYSVLTDTILGNRYLIVS